MSKRKKWFFSEEEYQAMKNAVSVPATVRNSLAVRFLRTWGATQTKLMRLIELATQDEDVLTRVKTSLELVKGYEKTLKLDKIVKDLRKALKL